MRYKFLFFIASLLLSISCAKSIPKTSLGDLVAVQKKEMVVIDDPFRDTMYASKNIQMLYELDFEGTSEIKYSNTSIDNYVLLDSSGRVYLPEFAGSRSGDGTLSRKDWYITGETSPMAGGLSNITAKDLKIGQWPMGKQWTFRGTLHLPKSEVPRKVTFVYLVSNKASGLVFKDGEQKFPLD